MASTPWKSEGVYLSSRASKLLVQIIRLGVEYGVARRAGSNARVFKKICQKWSLTFDQDYLTHKDVVSSYIGLPNPTIPILSNVASPLQLVLWIGDGSVKAGQNHPYSMPPIDACKCTTPRIQDDMGHIRMSGGKKRRNERLASTTYFA